MIPRLMSCWNLGGMEESCLFDAINIVIISALLIISSVRVVFQLNQRHWHIISLAFIEALLSSREQLIGRRMSKINA